jgi:hypothetical protein
MNLPTLPTLLSAFFLRYLAVERGVSPHTTTSYRDATKLLLQFAAARCRRSVDQLGIEDLTAPVVLEFLADLETSRGNTIRCYLQPCLVGSRKEGAPPFTRLSQRAGTWSSAGSNRPLG